ncbi:MAG: RnfABCDGE type electron transport complex subunit G [Candidatus Omnitrophica bacterium]|nr:RnfABCDGE type electron transport complex subunit G [Candidatus Omnitrophota bacterium]MCM8798409.1 RnfABCDGE type electron transport complex subunit G [Candidatus Omnitrophota bacterium]
MIRLGIKLMSVCFIASSILTFTYKITNPRIISQKDKEEKEALKFIYAEAEEFKKEDNHYLAYKNKNHIGYILKTSAQGYSGLIEMLVGFNKEGIIQGIIILEHRETPGLGAKISEVRYGEKKPWFLEQFKDKKASNLNFSTINAITGATISTRAVLEAVRNCVEEFLNSSNNQTSN